MAWPGTSTEEVRKVGCTRDKQDITPRTRKVPYLISSSYSGNILYVLLQIVDRSPLFPALFRPSLLFEHGLVFEHSALFFQPGQDTFGYSYTSHTAVR